MKSKQDNKISKHNEIILTQNIKDICRPLENLNISFFSHAHIDNNKNFSGITNNPQFNEHYLTNEYYNSDIHMTELNVLDKFIIWDAMPTCGQTEKLDKEAYDLGLKHSFTIIENNGSDYYHFSTHLDTTAINQVYLGNLDLLKMFILHFKEQVHQSKILSSIYDIKFSIDKNSKGFELKPDLLDTNDHQKSQFINELSNKTNDYQLSKRETECLLLTLHGNPAKQVAFKLGISQRTVEEHLNNIKIKMKVFSKAELIKKGMKIFSITI